VWRVSVPTREYYIMILYYVSFCIINYTINNYNTSGIIELKFRAVAVQSTLFFHYEFPVYEVRWSIIHVYYNILLYTAYACRLRRICIPVCLSRPARTAAAQLRRGAATAATCYNRMCAHRVYVIIIRLHRFIIAAAKVEFRTRIMHVIYIHTYNTNRDYDAV
jgi:hypothetical protein